VEDKISPGKRRLGLGLIQEKLAVTQNWSIAMNASVMNLQKLLEILFVLCAHWLQLLLGDCEAKKKQFWLLGSRTNPSKHLQSLFSDINLTSEKPGRSYVKRNINSAPPSRKLPKG
jgi:hypothetical protein